MVGRVFGLPTYVPIHRAVHVCYWKWTAGTGNRVGDGTAVVSATSVSLGSPDTTPSGKGPQSTVSKPLRGFPPAVNLGAQASSPRVSSD